MVMHPFKGELHPNNKLACLVLYLKIMDNFGKNTVCTILEIVKGTENLNQNLSRPTSLKLWIKVVKILF